jgi:hypothetical protein
MYRIDQTLELRKMMGPPLVRARYADAIDYGPGFTRLTPSPPVAIKRVHAVDHVNARINKCRSGQAVFVIKFERSGHNKLRPAVCSERTQFDKYIDLTLCRGDR